YCMRRVIASRSMKFGPSTCASRPCTDRRQRSIWNRRSCACTNPCAKNRSCSVCALMCAMPHRSRTTRTGCETPATASVPVICGSEDSRRAEAGACLWRPHDARTSAPSKMRLRGRIMALKDTLLSEFDHEMGTTRRLFERLPDGELGWRPHEKSMTIGGLATHLANLPNWGTTILNDASYDMAGGPPNLTPTASR